MKPEDGSVVVVTGGASGIGAACARRFAGGGGQRVVVLDRNATAGRAVAAEIGGTALACDITDAEAVSAAVEEVETGIGPVATLVACAGIVQDPTPPDRLPQADFDRVLDVNLRGTYLSCAGFGAAMARRGGGAIIAIASVAGMRSMPLHAYAPAKAAVISLVESLAGEWGRAGVRVNAVSPGYTLTPALQEQIDRGNRDPDRLRALTALGQLVTPEDVAEAVAFLASPASRMITGINLPVDAGWLVAGSWQTFGGVRGAVRETP